MMSSRAQSVCRPAAVLMFHIQPAAGVGVYWFVYLFTQLVMMFEHFLQERITNSSEKEREREKLGTHSFFTFHDHHIFLSGEFA